LSAQFRAQRDEQRIARFRDSSADDDARGVQNHHRRFQSLRKIHYVASDERFILY